ncbi:MAG: hypothetical protein JO022_14470 [Acidobacteriaceae bacterium]|nr:hypothetical protein [Acidobacteriaceae bacterium]
MLPCVLRAAGRRWLGLCLLLAILCGAAAFAQSTEPISKNALLKALRSHLSTSKELAKYVEARGVDFALTQDVESELRSAGATPELIEVVRAHSKAVTRPVVPAPAVDTTPPPAPVKKATTAPPAANYAPGIYRKDGAQWVKVLDEGVKWKASGRIHKFTVGLGKSELVGTIPGSSSPNLLKNPVVFLVSVPEGAQISHYLLIQMKSKRGSREINISPTGEEGKGLVPFSSRKVGRNLFEIDFTQGEGDYGFLPPGQDAGNGEMEPAVRMYTFRILQ